MHANLADEAAALAGNLSSKTPYVSKVTVVPLRSKVNETPETPLPDYEDDLSGNGSPPSGSANQRNSFKFVNNFQNIISNIRTIGIQKSRSFNHYQFCNIGPNHANKE